MRTTFDNLLERRTIEINFWRDDPIENPGSEALENLLSKCAEARIFLEKLADHHALFSSATHILELGGGQCWASCIVKRKFPAAHVTGTDISPFAVASVGKWEHVFGAEIDRKTACPSDNTPFPDCSFDLIFCYQAAHHFATHRRSLLEIKRILRPGGVAIYLHEPACRAYLHKLAKARVNAKRPEVPEDVLVYRRIEEVAGHLGLTAETRFAPTVTNRGPTETLYYLVLRRIAFLQSLLPCTVDIVFRKPK